jgi:hypothetical protein
MEGGAAAAADDDDDIVDGNDDLMGMRWGSDGDVLVILCGWQSTVQSAAAVLEPAVLTFTTIPWLVA